MIAEPTALSQLEAVREKYDGSVLCLEEVAPEDVSRYGIVDAEEIEPGVYRVRGLVEKPKPEDAPSRLAIMGRYLLSPKIFKHLKNLKRGAGGEYQLTDAMKLLAQKEGMVGVDFTGIRYDMGNKLGVLKAIVEVGLKHGEVGEGFREYLLDLVKTL